MFRSSLVAVGVLFIGLLTANFITTTGAGRPPSTAAASYTGPGDVVANATAWWGLRGYTAAVATANHPAVNLSRASDSHTCDIDLASNGGLGNTASCSNSGDNGTAVASWCNSTTCSVTKAYDQTQGNNCASATCDVSQATGADQPTITFSCFNSKPCMVGNGSTQFLETANGLTGTQPFTIEFTAERTGNTSNYADVFGAVGSAVQAGWANSANTALFYAGSIPVITFNDSVTHNAQFAYNGASGNAYFDGTSNPANPGADNLSGVMIILFQGNNYLTGDISEVGFWASAFNSTQAGNMCHNQYSYWSGNASC